MWWTNESGVELERLQRAERKVLLRALDSLGRRRLFRERIVEKLFPLLTGIDPSVRKAACVALGNLGAPESVPALMQALEDRDPQVRRAASEALRSITGLAHPPEAGAWKTALQVAE